MQVISISLEKKILNKNSATFKRILECASDLEQMYVVCHTPNKNYTLVKEKNLTIYPSNSNFKFQFIIDAFKIGKKIIKDKKLNTRENIITTQDPFETGLVGYLLSRKTKIGLHIQDHGNFFESAWWKKESFLNFLRYFLGRFLIKKALSVRTVSQREKDFLKKKFKIAEEKIIVLPIFTDWQSIATKKINLNLKKKYPDFSHYLLTICRLEKVKNIPLLISAFKEVLKKIPTALLVIIGDGSQREKIEKIISSNNLSKNIVLDAWTDDPYSCYKTTDLFVMSSYSEGWGLTAIEASACKCPIVMTDTGCANEFIFNKKNGWVVPINEKNLLRNAILEALLNPKQRNNFSDQAFKDLINLPNKKETLRMLKASWEKAKKSNI